MKDVTKSLIHDFQILEKGYDFMSYPPQNPPLTPHPDLLTYHHLLIPRRYGGPYSYQNGVILYTTPHSYLHVIESISPEHFHYLTAEMFDMKCSASLNPSHLHNIDQILTDFETKYSTHRTSKNKVLIKQPYLNRKHF